MEKNIFEDAKFGDKFVTRDGKTILVYLCNNGQHAKLSTDKGNIYEFTMNGLFDIYELKQSGKDIVSHYQEPIDEDELDELSTIECSNNFIGSDDMADIVCNITDDFDQATIDAYMIGFKAGYRKAKEG